MIPGKSYYDSLPVWAQTVAVNAKSLQTYRQKYGRHFHQELTRLAANERKPREQLLEEQQIALREMLEYARQHVPFYRELDLPADDLEAWPVIDKQTLIAAPEKFLSDEFSAGRLMSLQTSGTTGTPLTVWFTGAYHQTEMAFRWRHKAWGGVPFLSRGAYVSGHPIVPAQQQFPPFWRKDFVEQRLLCSSYHLAPRNFAAYAQALAEWRPEFVHGYPSSLYALAQAGVSYRPRAVFTASETLLDFQRAAIEAAFGVKAFNWYGNTEMTCNIVECAAGKLHYRTDYGYLEPDEAWRMVVTGLNNRAMPLIRYRIGDVVTMRPATETCACGCAFPLVERVEGRVEDYVRTPDGRQIGRLDHLFKDAQHVREAQIVQRQVDEVVLRVVRADGFGVQDEQTILAEARQRLGDGMRVRFEFVPKIERTAADKFRFVISESEHEQALAIATGSAHSAAAQVRDLFNERARTWGRMYRPRKKLAWRLQEFSVSIAEHLPATAHLLDFGCGTGDVAGHLQARGYAITACDIAEQMIATAREAHRSDRIEWVQLPTDWRNLPFDDGAFDGVVASSVFEYLEDVDFVLREMARVLRDGGLLVFSVPNPAHQRRKVENWTRRVAANQYLREVASCVPRIRRHIQYLDLSRNRWPTEQWDASVMQHGFHKLQGTDHRPGSHPLVVLAYQRMARPVES